MSATLIYCYDPMCSWCWAFAPTWKSLTSEIQTLVEKGDLKIIYLLGGLAVDSDLPMPEPMQEKLQAIWKHIETEVGTEFNHDFWQSCQPRRSTYPACRACLVARSVELETKMAERIQHAYYLHAKNPSDISTLVACAKEIGIEEEHFLAGMDQVKQSQKLEKEIHQARQLGLNSFPSIALLKQNQLSHIPIHYNNYIPMYEHIIKSLK